METKLTSIPNYQFLRADRRTRLRSGQVKNGGGLGIYYRSDLQVDADRHAKQNCSNPNIELQWAVISRAHTKRILIGNIYRPPDGNINEAIEQISMSMNQITDIGRYEVLLIGDFNIDYGAKGHPPVGYMKQFAAEHELLQVIKQPTRVTRTTQKTIDLAFTNIKYCTKSGVLNYNISDHKPIFIIKKKPRNDKRTTIHWGRTYRDCNFNDLAATLRENNTADLLTEEDPNKCWDVLLEMIVNAADKHRPLVTQHKKQNSWLFEQ